MNRDLTHLSPEEQLIEIKKMAVEIIPEEDLLMKLRRSKKENKPLIVKLGADPSRPDLHIGHSVPLRQMRLFQDMGHIGVLVIGDFTAMIGDPSGRKSTRPALSFEETRENGKSYMEQAYKILDPERTRITYNGDWLDAMSFKDVIMLASKYTLARMLERDDFEKRYKAEEPISIHELLYPLAQGYDSVALEADIELGGTDQKFNLLVGRELQRDYGQKEAQVIVTFPLLEGLDGVNKMSKSLDNYIGITDSPKDIFGRTMSIPDELITKYFRLVTDVENDEIERMNTEIEAGKNPMQFKKRLGEVLVEMYHSIDDAKAARAEFESVFSKGNIPEDIPVAEYPRDSEHWIVDIIREQGLADSGGAARRLIKQGALKIDDAQNKDDGLNLKIDREYIIKLGKRRFLKIIPA